VEVYIVGNDNVKVGLRRRQRGYENRRYKETGKEGRRSILQALK
jgi:hypothetical protein